MSSSGHLVVCQKLLGVRVPGVTVEVALHLGTLLSVVVYFRAELLRLVQGSLRWLRRPTAAPHHARSSARLLFLLVLGSVPAALAAFLLGDFFEKAFESTTLVGLSLIATGLLLLATRPIRRLHRRSLGELTTTDALVIGIAQAVAITPGISRSGATIATGLFLGLRSEAAGSFSFHLAIPAILGAACYELARGLSASGVSWFHLLFGAAVAAAAGFFALAWLMRVLLRGRLWVFAAYCLIAGAVLSIHGSAGAG